jgi:putative sigma-54 modulation protein
VNLQIKGKHVELNPDLKEYAERKLEKIERHLNDTDLRVELELEEEQNPAIATPQRAEATVWANGSILRAHENSADMKASIDLLVDKLERQAKRLHDKRLRKPVHATNHDADPALYEPEPEEVESLIVKTKQFALKPMSAEEAILQLELLGHSFFVFRNAETLEVNVLYRRRDGKYGLIEPQLL